jgi:hypothetical protein
MYAAARRLTMCEAVNEIFENLDISEVVRHSQVEPLGNEPMQTGEQSQVSMGNFIEDIKLGAV